MYKSRRRYPPDGEGATPQGVAKFGGYAMPLIYVQDRRIRPALGIFKLPMILLWVLSLQAFAAEQVDPPQTVNPPSRDEPNMLDVPHDYVAQKFVGMVDGIDRFFGDNRNFQEGNPSSFQVDLTKVAGYGGDGRYVLDGRAKVRLPNTEQRLRFLLESNPDQNPGGETPISQTPVLTNATTPSSYGAALRYEKVQESPWFFSTDAGVKFQGLDSSLFTRARGSYYVILDQWRVKFAASPFWFNNLGAGVSSQLDMEHLLSAPVLFRASSSATWLKDQQNSDLRQDLSIYHTLDERTALLYQASAIGATQPQYHAADYVLLVLYRYRLHQKWLFFEVSPQLHYPQIRNYQPSPMLGVRLEMLFDGIK